MKGNRKAIVMKSKKVKGKALSVRTVQPLEKRFAEVAALVRQARLKAYALVDTVLIDLYWEIGAYISRKVESAEWGTAVVGTLAGYLAHAVPDAKGFSDKNLWRMKRFYETYREETKVSALLRELSWTNNLLIMGKARSRQEREFYLRLCAREHYSSRDLEQLLDSGLFERSLTRKPKLSALLREIHPRAKRVFRNSYSLDFLGLPENHSEDDLRQAIVKNLRKFILEFGRDFSFVGQEYRVQVGNHDYFIDLLFYHRELRCLVAFELKIDEFKPEYLGKLGFYLEALDRDVKKKHENPSVGILLCKSKDDEVVEYTLSRTLAPAVVAEYKTKLPDRKLLEHKLHEFFDLSVKERQAEYNARWRD
jgi:predicted nuclease of restriction endonuclease-like (RecB) superfamily